MPTQKLGQASSSEMSALMQRHWDVDMKIRDILSAVSLDVKGKLALRLGGLIDEIKNELSRTEIGVQ
jgi:hypothetical protein